MITIPYPISYHGGHSKELCDHAEDDKYAVVNSYLNKGFKHVGITEHLPPLSDKFLYRDEIELGHTAVFLNKRFENYFKEEIPKLKKKLNLSSDYLFGFETEFYGENPEAHIEQAIQKYKPEIIVASVHHVDDTPIDASSENHSKALKQAGDLEQLYLRYYDLQLQLIRCLQKFSKDIPIVLGHMDLIRKHSPEFEISGEVISKINRNIKEAIKGNFAFEINLRALAKGMKEPYPQSNILSSIIKEGGIITIGDDSHSAEQVGSNYERLNEFYEGSLYVVEKNSNNYQWVRFSS